MDFTYAEFVEGAVDNTEIGTIITTYVVYVNGKPTFTLDTEQDALDLIRTLQSVQNNIRWSYPPCTPL